MFERIIQFAIEQRWLVLLAVLGMAGVGIGSYQKLSIDAVPDITNVQVQINTAAPATRRWKWSSGSPTRWRPSWPACRVCRKPVRCRGRGFPR